LEHADNVWIDGRWDSLCMNIRERMGIYRTEETHFGRWG
jgi:hypothetical protein